jgi:peptidyl-tRNA hydrolase
MDPADYVLAPFSNDEWPGLDPLFRDVQKAVEWIIEGNHLKAMNTFNVSPKPAAKK